VREPEEAVMEMRAAVEQLVIGGGPAGSTLAMRLAAAGREVVLLEKEQGAHHKVCGEFLSREAVAYLAQAGIEPRDLGACAITRVRLSSGRNTVEAKLPFTALSLSRQVMDEELLKRAQEAGCGVRRGAFAERLEARNGGWLVRLRGGEEIGANAVFLATGKHDVNTWERGSGTQSDLVGFKMHWRLAQAETEALRGVMDLFLFRGGYGGLALVEDSVANLCLVTRRKRLRALGGWTELLRAIREELPSLRERLDNATACWSKPLAISPIPYGYQAGAANGLWRVGDQAAVIPSFTGDGMSIALHSGALAAEMFLAGQSADDYVRCLADQLRGSMRCASALSRAMVTAGGRAMAPFLLSLMPGAIGIIATATRIPDRALMSSRGHEDAPSAVRPLPIA
jgi:menaquinone-9 beta-reductase